MSVLDIFNNFKNRINDNSNPNDNPYNDDKRSTGPKPYKCGITPEMVTSLAPNEVFVFGSNLQGMHEAGAARMALMHFGAKIGQGVGLQGQSYAIPTMQGPVKTIRPYVDEFIRFAKEHQQMHFLVTKIGCGIAGFTSEEIGLLFRGAIKLENVSLPKEFINVILDNPIVPSYVVKKVYGQTRTLVDILCEMSKEQHFSSAREALDALHNFLSSKIKGPDSIGWNFSLRSIGLYAEECITSRGLDIQKLYDRLEGMYPELYHGVDLVYKHYVIEKTIKMVELLNEFRRYSDPEELLSDLRSIGVCANNCGPQVEDYYFGFGSPAGDYLLSYFSNYTYHAWGECAPNGTLDCELYKEFMYRRNAHLIDKYGLDAFVSCSYFNDTHCHSSAYQPRYPYDQGAGPVFVEDFVYEDAEMEKMQRKFFKTCGDGIGGNYNPESFEFERIRPLIESDPKYVYCKDVRALVPKDDETLPIYRTYWGKILFTSEQVKQEAIRKIWQKYPELFGKGNVIG